MGNKVFAIAESFFASETIPDYTGREYCRLTIRKPKGEYALLNIEEMEEEIALKIISDNKMVEVIRNAAGSIFELPDVSFRAMCNRLNIKFEDNRDKLIKEFGDKDKVMEYINRAIDLGFMDDNCRWRKEKTDYQLALFVYKFCKSFGLDKTNWKIFEAICERKGLSSTYAKVKKKRRSEDIYIRRNIILATLKIDSIFADTTLDENKKNENPDNKKITKKLHETLRKTTTSRKAAGKN